MRLSVIIPAYNEESNIGKGNLKGLYRYLKSQSYTFELILVDDGSSDNTLEKLKRAGLRTAILSNGSPAMLDSAVDNAGIGDLIDENLSVEEVGIYKPDPRVYQLALDRLDVTREQVSFQSSNAWDAVGAAPFGFHVAWINRFGQGRERLTTDPEAEIRIKSQNTGYDSGSLPLNMGNRSSGDIWNFEYICQLIF